MTEAVVTRTRAALSSPSEKATSRFARFATGVIVALSAIGLLSTPIGDYDDSGLLLAARLVLAGKLPYVDFWANYGPFGYTFLALLLRRIENPALALRVGQVVLLAILACLAHWMFARRWASPGGGEMAVPLVVLALSTLSGFPSFPGLAFVLASLMLFLLARNSDSRAGGSLLAMLAGVALGLAALTRPAFGAYLAAAVLLAEGVLARRESVNKAVRVAGIFFVSSLVAGILLWLSLYGRIPVGVAFESAVAGPAQLIGGGRYLDPEFLRRGTVEAFAGACSIAGASLIWGFAAPIRRGRYAMALLLAAGALPPLLRWVFAGRPLSWLGFALFPPALLLVYLERRTLRENADMAAAAFFALAAAVFGHYSWTRPDSPHLLPGLVFAGFGAAFVWRRFRPWPGLAALALFLAAFQIATKWYWPVLPMGRTLRGDFRRPPTQALAGAGFRWKCEELSPDVARAVELADRNADPASRFVAVASSQRTTQGNPVLLFLISTRLPYTRWFHYEPGVQSSPAVQKEMERELLASGSRTAVVWRADRFLFDKKQGGRTSSNSSFDDFFNGLYPVTIGRFGDYEVRSTGRIRAHEEDR